jgi:hypothetical protein
MGRILSALFYCGLLPNAKKNPLMKRSRFLRLTAAPMMLSLHPE